MKLAEMQVRISSNLTGLIELLREAQTLAEQLQSKLQQIDDFELGAKVSEP